MNQLEISPYCETYNAPRHEASKCPPLIKPKESELQKHEAPLINVVVSLLAFIISECSSPFSGYGPNPITPFSPSNNIFLFSGKKFGINVGIPIPTFTIKPLLNSSDALAAIKFRFTAFFDIFVFYESSLWILYFSLSITLQNFSPMYILSTNVHGI